MPSGTWATPALWLHTKLVPVPRELQARRNAPSTLSMCLRLWSDWVSHCRRSGFSPSDPPHGAIRNWLQLNAAPTGLVTSALSWMARVSGLPSVHAQLQTPLCTAFLTATVPLERRELLERKVMCPDTPTQRGTAYGFRSCLDLGEPEVERKASKSKTWSSNLVRPLSPSLAIRAKSCRASMP